MLSCARLYRADDFPRSGWGLSTGDGDAFSSILAFAGRRRALAGRDAFLRKHLFLLHTDTDAPPAR